MEWLSLIVPAFIAYLGYNQQQIRKLHDRVNTMATKEDVRVQMAEKVEFIKEKIEDNLSPLQTQLHRLESRLDIVIEMLDASTHKS